MSHHVGGGCYVFLTIGTNCSAYREVIEGASAAWVVYRYGEPGQRVFRGTGACGEHPSGAGSWVLLDPTEPVKDNDELWLVGPGESNDSEGGE